MWLSWKIAVVCALGLGALSATLPGPRARDVGPVGGAPARARWRARATAARPFVREAAIVFVLYAVWRGLGEVSLLKADGAFRRGQWVWDVERALHLPNEVTLQRWTLHATWLVRFANLYYIVVHVLPLGAFLLWLFIRHRRQYTRWRNLLGFTSLVCLMIQWIPVAPPRLYPQLGFIDAGAVYGPRVYDAAGAASAGQLAAMPSMHVAWALVIGLAVWRCSTSRWRWVGPAHAVLTVFAVTVTAYHWLLDGIVAGLILVVGLLASWVWSRLRVNAPAVVPTDDVVTARATPAP